MKPMEVLGWFLVALTIALVLSVTWGCSAILMGNAIQQGQNLTPDQIQAYEAAGQSVYGCLQIGGPPPIGNSIWIVVPKGTPVTFKYGDNCHITQQ